MYSFAEDVKTDTHQQSDASSFRILSDIRRDVWHGNRNAAAYEWWYFDATSDDGRDVLVIIFLDNFIFSPRYNRHSKPNSTDALDDKQLTHHPAVAFFLYRDGRPVMRSLNEYPFADFAASTETPACRIGASGFDYDANSKTYRLDLQLPLRGKKMLSARLRWHTLDASLLESKSLPDDAAHTAHEWNMVAPRCHVTGDFEISAKGGRESFQWSGIGYHDHNRDARQLTSSVKEWQWGRAHFKNATAVFYRFQPYDANEAITRLFIAESGTLKTYTASCDSKSTRRNIFGLRYAREMSLSDGDSSLALEVKQSKIIDASFFYLRFTGQARLTANGETQTAPLISELLVPRALNWSWLDWLVDMRIARAGKTAFLP